jgi:hypothetical protein
MRKEAMMLALFVFVIGSLNYALAVRINEVELNPTGEDSGGEWIELYSQDQADLSGWMIENVKGKNMSVNLSFSGYKTLTTPYNFLANDKQKLILYDNENNKVQETVQISDSANNDKSWQLCGSDWVFQPATKESENDCGTAGQETKEEVNQQKTDETDDEKETNKDTDSEDDDKESKVETKKETSVKNDSGKVNNDAKETWRVIDEPEEIQVINLSKDIKTAKIWKSKTQYIKEYALPGFTVLCLIVLAYLIGYRKRKVESLGEDDWNK